MIITIDGPSGTGKSTVAKRVAKELGFSFFDTGAMYRSLAWWILQEKIDPSDQIAIAERLSLFHYQIHGGIGGEKRYFVGNADVTEEIRGSNISSVASKISAYPEVRQAITALQREFGSQGDAVFEGRDMGTVVFPNAEVKIFLTASADVRAKRRFDELVCKFPELAETFDYDQVLKEMEERDRNDATRAASPLKQAEDAILVDTSHLSLEQVVRIVLDLAVANKKYPRMKWGYWTIYWLARGFFRLFFRLKIYGLEHFRQGAGILASNHASNFDPPVLSVSCPEEVHFLAKESLFRVPLLGFLIRKLNSHPVSGTSTDVSTFRDIIHLLQAGHKVILFPEGTRSQDGQLKPLERGMAFIAQKAKCNVYPAYIHGTFPAWPRGKKLPKLFGRISVVFGLPIEWNEFEGLGRREAEQRLTEKTAESLHELKTWIEHREG